ncbi:MAG: TetR/AcrR family transcriptional regulator [Vibrio sp.]
MPEKKQGRRSAKEAENTKQQILCAAAELFCEFGYKKVSLRKISEQAGVSHSLLRYHFGSKEKIWQQISDGIYQQFQKYFDSIYLSLDPSLPPHVLLYKIMNRILARTLIDPRANRFLADAVRQNKNMVTYFLEPRAIANQRLEQIMQDFQAKNPESSVSLAQLRWQVMMHAHAATSLTPIMNQVFHEDKACINSDEAYLLAQWKMFSQNLALQLNVSSEYLDDPAELHELMIELEAN